MPNLIWSSNSTPWWINSQDDSPNILVLGNIFYCFLCIFSAWSIDNTRYVEDSNCGLRPFLYDCSVYEAIICDWCSKSRDASNKSDKEDCVPSICDESTASLRTTSAECLFGVGTSYGEFGMRCTFFLIVAKIDYFSITRKKLPLSLATRMINGASL